jgi:hypothetical protein
MGFHDPALDERSAPSSASSKSRDQSPGDWFTLPYGQFEAIAAGGGGADESRSLRQIEHTWRLLTLRVLLDLVGRQDTGPLGPVTEAWDLLARAHGVAPEAVDGVVMWS